VYLVLAEAAGEAKTQFAAAAGGIEEKGKGAVDRVKKPITD
jgi:hypothetical protein